MAELRLLCPFGHRLRSRPAQMQTDLRSIKVRDPRVVFHGPDFRIKEAYMSQNVGLFDRILRVIVGLVLIAYAIAIGFPITGWNWVGWIGIVPLATGVFGICPAYSVIGLSTCPAAAKPR